MPRFFAVVLATLLLVVSTARADTLHVFAAGSLTDAFSDLLRRFPAGPDSVAPPEFGPSGLLREKIETGAQADILASADMDHARQLALGHAERTVINFTRNRLCVLARTAIGLTPANMLARLLDPSVRLATSTPGADPGGDYAWAMFARAEAVHPGARAALEAKALKLVGVATRHRSWCRAKAPWRACSSPTVPTRCLVIAAARDRWRARCRVWRSCRCRRN